MKRRHVLAVLGLSFVTLGIYMIYWLYKTRKELLQYLPDKKVIPPVFILLLPALVLLGLFILLVVWSEILVHNSPTDDVNAALGVLTVIVLLAGGLAIFVVSFWWFYKYFKALEAVTQGNDAMLLYTLWISLTLVGLGPIWVLVAQNDLNKFIENGHRPLRMAYPGPAPQDYPHQHTQPEHHGEQSHQPHRGEHHPPHHHQS